MSEKQESLSIEQIKMDALSIFDFSTTAFEQPLPIVIHGLSMGSLVGSYVASERAVDGLILDGAINSVPQLVDNLIPFWVKLFSTVTIADELAQIDNTQLLKAFDKPILFLIGSADSTTPVAFSEQLYRLSPSSNKVLEILPQTEHAQSLTQEAAITAYKSFIASLDCCANY